MCIRVLGGTKNYASVGDIIIGVVKESAPRMPVKRSEIVRALFVVRTRKTISRKNGTCIRFDDNAAVLN